MIPEVRHRRRALSLTAVTFFLLLLALFPIHRWYQQRLLREQRSELRTELALLGNSVSLAIDRRLNVAGGLEAFIHTDPLLTRFEQPFRAFSGGLSASTPGIRTIAVAPNGFVRHVYPRDTNRDLLGRSLLDEPPPGAAASIQSALENNVAVVSPPLTLADGVQGLTIQQPVYDQGRLWGVLYFVYELEPILANAGLGQGSDPYAIAILDDSGALIYGDAGIEQQSPATTFVSFADGGWQLAAAPREGWAAAVRAPLLVFDALALAVILLAAGITYQITNKQVELQEAVRRRTRELTAVNEQLEQDIAARKRVESELRRARGLLAQRVEERTRELQTLLEVTRHVASARELPELLGLILDQLKTVVDYTGAAILTYEHDRLEMQVSRGLPAGGAEQIRLQRDNDIDRLLLETEQPIVISDVRADTPLAQAFRRAAGDLSQPLFAGLRSWMALPLIIKGQVIGVLVFHHAEPDHYTEPDANPLMAFANHVAVAIQNARLFNTERRRAEQFRLIGNVSREITAILAMDEVANQAAYLIQQAFGYYHVHIGLVEDNAVVFKAAAGVWRTERECRHCSNHHFGVGQNGASGHVAATGEPLVVSDVRRDPHYVPMHDDQVGSALILPLKLRGRTVGVLNIESDALDAFDETAIGVLQPLANQLAIALENARLYAEAQMLAAVRERQKLARELHDSVSQALYGIGLGTRTALKLLESGTVDAARLGQPLDYVLSMATAALAEMRALIFELRPESLAVEGLVPALNRRVDTLRARHDLQVEVAYEAEPDIALPVKEVLYRVAQEALHNVVKHANAGQVRIALVQDDSGGVTLEITDDGSGFDPQTQFPGHLGLQSMRERVEGVGGHFSVESARGAGTTVRASVGQAQEVPAAAGAP